MHNPVQSVDYVTIADTLGADVGRTVTRLEAATVAGIILDRAKGNPRNPTRYVLGSLRKSPHEWARFIIDGTVPA